MPRLEKWEKSLIDQLDNLLTTDIEIWGQIKQGKREKLMSLKESINSFIDDSRIDNSYTAKEKEELTLIILTILNLISMDNKCELEIYYEDIISNYS